MKLNFFRPRSILILTSLFAPFIAFGLQNDFEYSDSSQFEVTASPCESSLSIQECEVLQLINAERRRGGSVALRVSSKCQVMARSHSTDMAKNRFFSHTSPTKGTFSQRVRQFRITGASGENIAMGSSGTTSRSILNLWMNSSGHRRNILNPAYRSSGVGVVSNGTSKYFTQCFSSSTN